MFAGMPDFNQSLEMMKTMWGNMGANADGNPLGGMNMPGAGSTNPFGMPTMDVEELDKRIKELKSVESWLTLNLNVLKTTIQGLEVQRATLGALHAFADSMQNNPESGSKAKKNTKSSTTSESDTMDAASNMGGMAVDMMNNMAQAMTDAMSAIPGVDSAMTGASPSAKKPARKSTASKTSKSRPRKAASTSGRRAKGS
jgi:hypothetical protein